MRRTYKSKKETGSGLDPRDVVLTMDEKSSVFDAFYIQNIKQSKKELFVGSSTFAASNKVRKRKYVKRLKEQEPIRESVSRSTYLTPDKSIHVKKALDPFDLLLNSSSVNEKSLQPVNNVFSPIQTRGVRKAYRKKTHFKQRFNYSDSDNEDMDKENSYTSNENSLTHNKSDILSHKLQIEKANKTDLQYIDDSIDNMVQDLSLLDIVQCTNSQSPSILSTVKHKLSLSSVQNSPLCSTPFHKKYRGKSIFKFSPISVNVGNNSKHSTISEKQKGTMDNEDVSSLSLTNKRMNVDKIQSPILPIRIDNCVGRTKGIEMSKQYFSLLEETSVPETSEAEPFLGFSDNAVSNSQNINLEAITNKHLEKQESHQLNCSKIDTEDLNNIVENVDKEASHTNVPFRVEEDLFLKKKSFEALLSSQVGLAKNSVDTIDLVENNSLRESGLEDSLNQFKELEQSIANDTVDEPTQVYSDENSIVENDSENSLYEEEISNGSVNNGSLYESCDSVHEVSYKETVQNCPNQPLVIIEKLSDSVFREYYEKKVHESQNDETCNDSYSSSINKSDTVSYSTSSSRGSFADDEKVENSLHVVVEKLSDSVFRKYCEKKVHESQNDETCNDSLSSSINKSDTVPDRVSSTSVDLFEDDVPEDTMLNLTNFDQDADDYNYENNKSEEDIFVSFVTLRRRRCEIKKDSFIFSLENSLTSGSSGDLEKTVLRNNKDSIDSVKENNDVTAIGNVEENTEAHVHEIDQICNSESLVQNENINNEVYPTDSSPVLKLSTKSGSSRHSIIIPSSITRRSPISLIKKINKISVVEEKDQMSRSNSVFDTNEMTRKRSQSSKESLITNPNRRLTLMDQNISTKCDVKTCSNTTFNDATTSEIRQGIVLEPGKRWERSLSIYRRMTTMGDHFDHSIIDDEPLDTKGRKYRQSVINTMEMQDRSVSLHNESIRLHRSTICSKPSRSTIKILRESNASRISLCSTTISEDLEGFLTEDCDDTIVELSKLTIIDSEHDVNVLDKFNDTSNRITTARDFVLRRCDQTDVLLFDECYPDTDLKNCRKIGEGVYGEVFLWRAGDGRARVLKIVPIAGAIKVNGESQKDYDEIISEIVIAMELSALRAPIQDIEKHFDEGEGVETLDLHSVENATDVFNEVLAVRCVYGSYPSRLLDLWELFDECKGSENDNPAVLPPQQQFVVLELANAGQDLESYRFHNAEQAYALFKQVAFGLAVAEESFQFEHRDLHWGNVLISPTDQKYATFVLRGRAYRVARRGVAATVIDYSLSRLSLRLSRDARDAGDAALYNDLAADDGLFDAVGDYQFEVYRLMREKLGNDWKNFEPYTNILWLHYTVDKMITALRYTRTNTKIHKHYIAKLKEIKNRILDYGSAVQYVLTDNEL